MYMCICAYVHGPWGLNMPSLVEDISSIMKSITLPIFVLLLCTLSTNDMDGSWGWAGLKWPTRVVVILLLT